MTGVTPALYFFTCSSLSLRTKNHPSLPLPSDLVSATNACLGSIEFKEIRKEWKARKKEEEAQRKASEEEARRRAQDDGSAPPPSENQPPAAGSPYVSNMASGQRQLPPLSYQPGVSMAASNGVHYSPTTAPTAPMENMQQYTQQPIQPIYSGYPAAPQYGAQPQAMYGGQQRAVTTQSNGNTSTTAGGENPVMDVGPRP